MFLGFVLACVSRPAAPGIVVVSLDTLRADHLGAYGSTENLTPNLDRFAEQAFVFEHTYAQANETLYSHAALFTSRYPSELAPLDAAFRVPAGVPTLGHQLGGAGWDTAAFVAGGHLSRGFGFEDGFADYTVGAAWGSLRDTGRLALQWLDQHDRARPFFVFVHGYDTHDRYLKPPPWGYADGDPTAVGLGADLARRPGEVSNVVAHHLASGIGPLGRLLERAPRFDHGRALLDEDPDAEALTGADEATLRAAYAGAVRWGDAAFGLLLAGLEARGLLATTTVVVLSDHGEELGEDGAFHHRYGLTDPTLAVPLVIAVPGRGGGRVDGLTELVDVAPTLLDLAGAPALPDAQGRSLVPAFTSGHTSRDVAFSESELRSLSARGPRARLTAEGLSASDRYAAALLPTLPIDGVTLRLDGPADDAPALRSALAGWRAAVVAAP